MKINNKMHTFLILLITTCFSCTTEVKTQFPPEALNETFVTLSGENIQFKDVLKRYPNQQIVIDVWASWCGDCIKGMPKVKALQKQFPEATYVFLSLDKNQGAWKRGIQKYKVEGEHYYLPSGFKGAFGKAIDLDWIPRYMVADSEGNITLYKAIEADDKKLISALTK